MEREGKRERGREGRRGGRGREKEEGGRRGEELWAYATMGREPRAGMMSALEGQAEALTGTFNAQNMANTLWAYATMGREPGAGRMKALEGRAEAQQQPDKF